MKLRNEGFVRVAGMNRVTEPWLLKQRWAVEDNCGDPSGSEHSKFYDFGDVRRL
jgi:hypothetical protein